MTICHECFFCRGLSHCRLKHFLKRIVNPCVLIHLKIVRRQCHLIFPWRQKRKSCILWCQKLKRTTLNLHKYSSNIGENSLYCTPSPQRLYISSDKHTFWLCNTVKALYFAGIIFCIFPMNVISLVFNFADFAFVTMHCQNVRVVFNFAETIHTQNSWNKFHVKI